MVVSRRAALRAAAVGLVATIVAGGAGAQGGRIVTDARIEPGVGIGPVRLGMSREAVLRALEIKPVASGMSGGYREDTFRWAPAGRPRASDVTLGVISRSGRVVQVWTSHPACLTTDGLNTSATFSAIRRKMPKLSVRDYSMIEEGGGGYVLLFFDDVRRGIAFTTGTQDDQGTYQALPTLEPGSIVVHPVGERAIPLEFGLLGRPGRPYKDSYIPRIRQYMNGGAHRPQKG